MNSILSFVIFGLTCIIAAASAQANDYVIREFQKQEMTPIYWSEGAAIGDFNNDGNPDIVSGPNIFLGPNFDRRGGFRHEFYPAQAPTRRDPNDFSYYSLDNFFSFPSDINDDGWTDVLVVGLPNTPAYWYENPGKPFGGEAPDIPVHWTKHFVTDAVKNEAPDFVDLTGDGEPELLTAYDEHYGYVSPNPVSPSLPWIFHPISTHEEVIHHYTHGMGIGDIDGDGRQDFITGDGWMRQPDTLTFGEDWEYYPFAFVNRQTNPVFCCFTGGGTMHAYDVNGDGLNDVITSKDAHGWGLSWFEQVRKGEEITFTEHAIMSVQEENTDNPYGVQFSQLHDIELVDIDGDGLKDILTGKTYRAHDFGDEGSRQDPVIYYFRLTRLQDGTVDYVPYQIDDEAGIGRQLVSGDLNGDEHVDFVVGNKKGAFAFTQKVRYVERDQWEEAQPVRIKDFGNSQAMSQAQQR